MCLIVVGALDASDCGSVCLWIEEWCSPYPLNTEGPLPYPHTSPTTSHDRTDLKTLPIARTSKDFRQVMAMAIPVAASTTALQALPSTTSSAQHSAASGSCSSLMRSSTMQVPAVCNLQRSGSIWKSRRSYSNSRNTTNGSRSVVVCAFGDVSSDGTTYLVAGAVAVALLGTAFPILFSRKDLCPECDGAGFTRKTDRTLRANAARKDEAQIVCPRCNGLGKLGQVDK